MCLPIFSRVTSTKLAPSDNEVALDNMGKLVQSQITKHTAVRIALEYIYGPIPYSYILSSTLAKFMIK